MGDQSDKYRTVVSILLQNEVALESVQVTSDPIIESINPTKEDRIVNFERACFQEYDDYQGREKGRAAALPDSTDTLSVFQSWGADYA